MLFHTVFSGGQRSFTLSGIALSALVAGIPLYMLFFMLAVKRMPGHKAAFFATFAALLLAIICWGMPAGLAVGATLYGAAIGLFPIIWIVITAIWVYNMPPGGGVGAGPPLLYFPDRISLLGQLVRRWQTAQPPI